MQLSTESVVGLSIDESRPNCGDGSIDESQVVPRRPSAARFDVSRIPETWKFPPHVHDHDSRSRRWGEYWLELLGDSGFVPEDRLAAVKKETGELKGIFVSIVVNTKAKSKNPKL
jgi:hypothetical protein